MDGFLIEFFPTVYKKKLLAHENNYCKYDNQFLQLFTSSLYLAALFSSFPASKVCENFGRKKTIFLASVFFLIGAGLSSGAKHLWMLIVGRVFLGFGVGFGNEVLLLQQFYFIPPLMLSKINNFNLHWITNFSKSSLFFH